MIKVRPIIFRSHLFYMKKDMKDYIIEKLKSYADNEYMDKYIEICTFYQDHPYTKDKKFEYHHIFTSFLYKNIIEAKNRDKTIDKLDEDFIPEDNIVKLPSKWHLISHWYLAKALKIKEAINAFQIFIEDYIRLPEDYTREEIEKLALDYHETCPDNNFNTYVNRKDKENIIKDQQKDWIKQKQKEEQDKKNLAKRKKMQNRMK